MGQAVDFAAERNRMVEQLVRSRYVLDSRVRDAFLAVPREAFVRPEDADDAYADVPLPIGRGQTISAPSMIAIMLDEARLAPGDHVLEIGTGSGYHAALVAHIVGPENVVSIERVPRLAGWGRADPTSLRARRWTAPSFIGERLVDRLLGRGLFVHQNAVEIRFVQRPVEDSPVPAVQQGDGLPEALKQAGVVQRVKDLPVVRMDRVVDDHAPETEVTHHRARLRKGLRLGAAKAFRNGLRKLLDCDHLVLHFLR